MKNYCLAIVGMVFMMASVTSLAQAEDTKGFIEPGRFGLGIVSQSTSGHSETAIGLLFAYQHEQFEVNASFGSAWEQVQGTTHEESGDYSVVARLGKRFNIGDFNYISLGASFASALGQKDAGVANPFNYQVGPYVGLQRNFQGSHLMLSAWILPYAYERFGTVEEIESKTTWFHKGGVAMTYLF